MKRYGNLYPKIYDMNNIRLAHKNARKGKTKYKEVQMVDKNPEKYFLAIHTMLKNKTFRNSEYQIFTKIDKGKEREIYRLPYFPDRIIHHCIVQVLEPIWVKTFITDTYSSIKKRGIHKAVRKIQRVIPKVRYCLKLDISKFYPSVDHDRLKEIIASKIKDKDVLWILNEIIDSAKGIPIGNYLSQYFGNLYLSGLDHYIKEELRCKNYFRYCDDLVILDVYKTLLFLVKELINTYVKYLLLKLKGNYSIFPLLYRGLDFLGYRFFFNYTLLRKRIAKAIKDKKDIHKSFISYLGWMKYGNCFNLLKYCGR